MRATCAVSLHAHTEAYAHRLSPMQLQHRCRDSMQQHQVDLSAQVQALSASLAAAQQAQQDTAVELESLAPLAADAERLTALVEALQQQNEVLGARVVELEGAMAAAGPTPASAAVIEDLQRENAVLQATVAEFRNQLATAEERVRVLEARGGREGAGSPTAAGAAIAGSALLAKVQALQQQLSQEEAQVCV
jgi:hypothetical protein